MGVPPPPPPGIPFGVATRVKRNCSTPESFEKQSIGYQNHLINRDYNRNQVRQQFDKDQFPERTYLPLQLRSPTKCFHWFWITTPIYPTLAKSCIHINISFMILPPLQKYSPKGLLFHRLGDLETFKTFFHAPIKLMIVALTSVVALNAKVNGIFVIMARFPYNPIH